MLRVCSDLMHCNPALLPGGEDKYTVSSCSEIRTNWSVALCWPGLGEGIWQGSMEVKVVYTGTLAFKQQQSRPLETNLSVCKTY